MRVESYTENSRINYLLFFTVYSGIFCSNNQHNNNHNSLPRSVLMERNQSQKEEEMLKQIQDTLIKGKTKIDERFEELIKEVTEGLEREQRRMEAQYVSQISC